MAEQSAYLIELAETIGPRPATTDVEARAAQYVGGVFAARGLEVETQEFDAPRTYSWAYILYHLLTIGSAAAAGLAPLRWYAFALAFLTAYVFRRDLDTRWGLTALMPKGPSQNVIARHVPKQRRGESQRKVVIVAHYDSARSSLAFSPGMVRNFNVTFSLMKWATWLVPLLVLAAALLQTFHVKWPMQPWLWYVTLVPAAYLLVPLLINLHRELLMRATPGANDNASGVAAMLGVMEQVVPEPDAAVFETSSLPKEVVRRSEEDVWAADLLSDEETVLSYTPAGGPRRTYEDDFGEDLDWEDTTPTRGQTAMPLSDEEAAAPAGPPVEQPEEKRRRGLLGRGKERKPAKQENVRDWLGVDAGFDAKKEGNKIGSWDQFEDEDDDDLGLKGGSAGEGFDDPDFAADEAARIRRKVTAQVDRSLAEKEVWFVATGAEEVGTAGMKAFLAEFADDLRDALIINIDNVGAGNVAWVETEGMAKRYRCDRRLAGAARRVARENEWPIRGTDYRGLSTDATPALARRFRAMSVMAFDINGRLPNWHWSTDTVSEVEPETVQRACEFVTALVKEL